MPKRDKAGGKVEKALRDYHAKRDFSRTAEPRGAHQPGAGRTYIIQKHAARRLHFDFRLELDGVLKSWAVPNGPSRDPGTKRLAVRTEDHPLDYAAFEGTIPAGEYGGGTVMLWDRGSWEPVGDPRTGLREGRLKFRVHGERLKGGYALVRMRTKPGERRENWLLVKEKDDQARAGAEPTARWKASVSTGRSMSAIAKGTAAARSAADHDQSPPVLKGRGAGHGLPAFIAPQLATLVTTPPDGPEWLHEIKYDGYRAVVAIDGADVRIHTRSGKDWTGRFSALRDAFGRLDVAGTLMDGEIVAFDAGGRSSFADLQRALKGSTDDVMFIAFDLLYGHGKDLRQQPLHRRKVVLKDMLKGAPDRLRYGDHMDGNAEDIRIEACRLGLEGIVSKRREAAYVSKRSRGWLKSKCLGRDDMVVGGYRESSARSRPLASLLLGEYGDKGLEYRGRVGTGFDADTLQALHACLLPLSVAKSPFVETPAMARRGARWVAPRVVVEVAYTERTRDGLLRHPVFLGVREDKKPEDVRRQQPTNEVAMAAGSGTESSIQLTHPDRVLFPGQGITKRQLADYLLAVADHLLPHAAGRPISLVRCPEGRGKKCFFQRHRVAGFPDAFRTVRIREKDGDRAEYLYIEDAEGLVAAAQMGVLELHGWGSTVADIEKPDRMVFDLDPADDVTFADVRASARQIRDVLEGAGLRSFPLLTGGKGIHVVVPLDRSNSWDEVKAFAAGLARRLADAEPHRYVDKAAKAARRGRIFLDWMRNQRGATAILPFSPRARENAPVAVPVSWREVGRVSSAAAYTVRDVAKRLRALRRDPWDGYADAVQRISREALTVVRIPRS